jgi:hypothetical protein
MAKEIYAFTVDREVEVEVTETKKKKNKETGKMENIPVTIKATEAVPNEIIISRPNRRQIEEADMEYSVEVSKCIKRGILTRAMLAKKYSDSGGVLSEEDAEFLTQRYGKLADLQADFTRLDAKEKKNSRDKERIKELTEKISGVRTEIVDMESSYSSLFNHTADTKAQNKAILWYMLNLTEIKETDDQSSRPLFEGETFDEKLDHYYKLEEEGDDFYSQVSEKLPSYISLWYFSPNPTKEDFDNLSKELSSDEADS